MSLTMTMLLVFWVNKASLITCSVSMRYPEVRNVSAFATRSGVSTRPSRSGSSPISASNSRTRRAIRTASGDARSDIKAEENLHAPICRAAIYASVRMRTEHCRAVQGRVAARLRRRLPGAMRQIWITKAGAPEVLKVKEAPDPEPRAGELRIRVQASGVNFADIIGRMGLYPDLPPIPVVPGYEVAGRVDAAAAGLDGNRIGRDVVAMTRFGGYADTVCVPAKQVFARPSGMSALEAAAIPVNYFTAWQLIVVMGGLKRNETVLVHSAGGGVGIAATQIAKHLGGRVIGTASAGKHAEFRALGIEHLIG